MDRLTYWNNKEKSSALPATINDNGDTVGLETLCAKLAAYEDAGLEPSEIPTGLELANVYAAMQELKRYKDAEEQGLLAWLPCKAGDKLYETRTAFGYLPEPQEKSVVSFMLAQDGSIVICCKDGYKIRGCKIGKTVFLTREAAEAALAEMTDTAAK